MRRHLSGAPHAAIGLAAGAVAWSLTEYAMHRWVLHGPFGHGRWRRVPIGGLHRAHHRDPEATSLPARAGGHLAIAGVGAAAALALGTSVSAPLARAAGAAWSAGYSTYEISHWNMHHRPARSTWGRHMRARHTRHHYGAPGSNLGVTMSWWDRLLGTEGQSESLAA